MIAGFFLTNKIVIFKSDHKFIPEYSPIIADKSKKVDIKVVYTLFEDNVDAIPP